MPINFGMIKTKPRDTTKTIPHFGENSEKTMVILISGQPDPNLLPIIDNNYRPSKVVLVHTADKMMTDKYHEMNASLENIYAKTQLIEVKIKDCNDMQEMISALNKLSEEIGKENLIFNITAGKKPMSFACLLFCQVNHIPFFYTDIESNSYIQYDIAVDGTDITVNRKSRDIRIKDFELKNYLLAKGLRVETKDFFKYTPADIENMRRFTEKAINQYEVSHKVVSSLNGCLTNIEQQYKKELSRANKNSIYRNICKGKADDLLRYCKDWCTIEPTNYQNNKIVEFEIGFTAKQIEKPFFFFMHGGWLEDLIYDLVKEILDGENACIEKNLTIRSEYDNKNEGDIVIFFNNTLFVIEAKTQIFHEHNNDNQNVIHKLSAITNKIGGKKAKCSIVSYMSLTNAMKVRAAEYNIATFDNRDFSNRENLKTLLLNWLKPANNLSTNA